MANHEKRVGNLEAVPLGGNYEIKVVSDTNVIQTGDSQFVFVIPINLTGRKLVEAHAFVSTVSSSGKPTVQIRNATTAADMLSTRITIDVSEFTSFTAAVPAVTNMLTNGVVTGDRVAVDVDVAGTGARGLGVILRFA